MHEAEYDLIQRLKGSNRKTQADYMLLDEEMRMHTKIEIFGGPIEWDVYVDDRYWITFEPDDASEPMNEAAALVAEHWNLAYQD